MWLAQVHLLRTQIDHAVVHSRSLSESFASIRAPLRMVQSILK